MDFSIYLFGTSVGDANIQTLFSSLQQATVLSYRFDHLCRIPTPHPSIQSQFTATVFRRV